MAAYFESIRPKQLLADFDAAIALGNGKGGIATWKKTPNGYYTHTSAQYGSEAFLQAIISGNRLAFYIIKPQNKVVTMEAYAYYHGHIINTMLNHFNAQFSLASATAQTTVNDRCS
jgi:hypothetical protein